ncbi:MAG: hypothetical protein AAFV95_11765 [Bacteroidota bacterium]
MSKLRFLSRTPKHQRFEYIPRYWDPDKEELRQRIENVQKAKDGDPEAIKERISGGLRRSYNSDRQYRARQIRKSNLTLLLVIVALVVLTFFFIQVYLPVIANYFETNNQLLE